MRADPKKEIHVSALVLKLLLAPAVGALAAGVAMGGLVWSQTQPPSASENPGNQEILTYGE